MNSAIMLQSTVSTFVMKRGLFDISFDDSRLDIKNFVVIFECLNDLLFLIWYTLGELHGNEDANIWRREIKF